MTNQSLITEIKVTVKGIEADMVEVKGDIKDLKNIYTSLEKFSSLEERVEKMESNNNKLLWIVLVAVAERILSLILK